MGLLTNKKMDARLSRLIAVE